MRFYPWRTSTRPSKETFTARRGPHYTSAKSSSSKRQKPTPPPPPLPECPSNNYIPHHRNLGLKPGATDEEVRAAWRKLSIRLHPDKIRDPVQKAVAQKAMILVNHAYEELHKEGGGIVYRVTANWLMDRAIDDSELARRKEESNECRRFVERKPWIREYVEKHESVQMAERKTFNELFWVNFVHRIVDGMLPRSWSDRIWELDHGWRKGGRTSTNDNFEKLSIYGPCYTVYTVTLPKLKGQVEKPKWSYYIDTKCAETPLHPGFGDTILIQVAVVLFVTASILFWRKQIAWVATRLWRLLVVRPISALWACVILVWKILIWPFRWANNGSWIRCLVGWAVFIKIYLIPIDSVYLFWAEMGKEFKNQE